MAPEIAALKTLVEVLQRQLDDARPREQAALEHEHAASKPLPGCCGTSKPWRGSQADDLASAPGVVRGARPSGHNGT